MTTEGIAEFLRDHPERAIELSKAITQFQADGSDSISLKDTRTHDAGQNQENGKSLDNAAVAATRPIPRSSAADESSNKEVTPELTGLADSIAELANQLRVGSNLEQVWQNVRAALHETLSLLADSMLILPSFGDDCDAQLAMLLQRVRSLAAALALSVGDVVAVEYSDRRYEGVVTGLEDALRADGADVRVRYGGGGDEVAEDPAEGGLRLIARGTRRPSARAGGAPPPAQRR